MEIPKQYARQASLLIAKWTLALFDLAASLAAAADDDDADASVPS